MVLYGIALVEIDKEVAESVELDQAARMCSLILLYTLRKINSLLRSAKRIVLFYYHVNQMCS